MSKPSSSVYIWGTVPKLPPKAGFIVMPLLMSGLMSGIVCMVNLISALGWTWQALATWPMTWLMAWAVAFPSVTVVMPLVKRLTGLVVRSD